MTLDKQLTPEQARKLAGSPMSKGSDQYLHPRVDRQEDRIRSSDRSQ